MIFIKYGSLAAQMIIESSLKQSILKELNRDYISRNYTHYFSIDYYFDYSTIYLKSKATDFIIKPIKEKENI